MAGHSTVALTCEGENGRLAIETDGDGRHDHDTIVEELNKQSVLERLGWRFVRLRASEYYRGEKDYLIRLSNTLLSLVVKPGGGAAETADLSRKVIARAAELVAEWDAENAVPDTPEEFSAELPEEAEIIPDETPAEITEAPDSPPAE